MNVADITKVAVCVSGDASFQDALTRMLSEHTNTLLVTNESGELVGEVSVSDLLDAIVPDYLDGDSATEKFANEENFRKAVADAAEKPVMEFMSNDYDAVTAHDSMMTIAATAIAHQRARMPVVDAEGRPVGMISRQGLKHILAQYLGLEPTPK